MEFTNKDQKINRFESKLTHPGPGWGPVRVGARSGLGPIWALMGPPGQVLAGPDMSDFRLLIEFRMFCIQNSKVYDFYIFNFMIFYQNY